MTLHLSDHLAIHTKVALDNGGSKNITKGNRVKKNKEFRIFNEANNNTFKTLIDDEPWDNIHDDMGAQEHYDTFTETYMRHYNHAYPIKTKRELRKAQERTANKIKCYSDQQ